MPPDRAADLHAVYAASAETWDRQRSRSLFERPWLDRFRALIPPGGSILDLGCGTGAPLAEYLIAQGHPVTGVDFAEPMLAIARARFPGARWIAADMRGLDLGARFAGLLAWDSFFHLTAEEQRGMFPVFARHLVAGAPLLFTSGPDASDATGAVAGRPVAHSSISPDGYAACLAAHGFLLRRFVAEDPECDLHTVWLAQAATC